jgi:hypothetical protein
MCSLKCISPSHFLTSQITSRPTPRDCTGIHLRAAHCCSAARFRGWLAGVMGSSVLAAAADTAATCDMRHGALAIQELCCAPVAAVLCAFACEDRFLLRMGAREPCSGAGDAPPGEADTGAHSLTICVSNLHMAWEVSRPSHGADSWAEPARHGPSPERMTTDSKRPDKRALWRTATCVGCVALQNQHSFMWHQVDSSGTCCTRFPRSGKPIALRAGAARLKSETRRHLNIVNRMRIGEGLPAASGAPPTSSCSDQPSCAFATAGCLSALPRTFPNGRATGNSDMQRVLS